MPVPADAILEYATGARNIEMPRYRRALFNRFVSARRARSRTARATGPRMAMRRTRTMTMRRRTNVRTGILGGVDANLRTIYTRRPMNRRKRRRWVKFCKKINYIQEKDLGTRTVLFSNRHGLLEDRTNYQGCFSVALYPFVNDIDKTWLNDMQQIGGMENVLNPTQALGNTTYGSTKFLFQSAVLDMTIRNTSTYKATTEAIPELDPRAALEVDVYDIIMNKDMSNNSTVYTTLSSVFNSYDDPEIGGVGNGIAIQDRGASPFEFGAQMGRFGVKVLKKTKYFIPNSQTITRQIRDPRRHVIPKDQLTDNDGCNRPGWTRWVYIIFKAVPGLDVGGGAGQYQQRLQIGLTRKYSYKIEGVNEARERYVTSYTDVGLPS